MKCIILAGGSGERLWPVSRDLYPKALLSLDGEKSLVQNVYELALSLTSEKNIITITNIRQYNDLKIQLKQITKNPIIVSEPDVKNTLAALCLGLTYVSSEKKDETVVVLPSDFNIDNKEIFIDTIKKAQKLAKYSVITAIGIKPQYFEDGFGYMEKGEKFKDGFKVNKFIEKPDIKQIKKNSAYLWNSGIYTAKASVFVENIKKYCPDIIQNFSKDMFDINNSVKYGYYENLPEISMDYALMEKTDKLVCLELNTMWYDYGSWRSIYNMMNLSDTILKDKNYKLFYKKDKESIDNEAYNATTRDLKNKNIIIGNVVTSKVKNSFIYSSKELVAAAGIKDKIIIETEDAILVCNSNKTSEINSLVKKLKKNNEITTKISKTVYRPWGYYTCLNEGDGWLTKLISVSPMNKLSLQSHNYRSEHWVVLEGCADVVLDGKKYSLKKGKSIDIPLKSKHSLQNNTKEALKILEVQRGEIISEDDIIRYEDMYGRV